MKHLLIILSFLLLSSPVIGDNHTLPVLGVKKVKLFMDGVNTLKLCGKDLEKKKLTLYIRVKLRMEFQMVLVF